MAARSWPGELDAPLGELDPHLAGLLAEELARQGRALDLVASENLAPAAVLELQGSVLTNKYADGYPGAREYDGCAVVDEFERLAIERAKALFGAEHANVQPYSGSSANYAVLQALCEPGDTVLGWDFEHGGHPSHYAPETIAGRFYRGAAYHLRRSDRLVDMEEVARLAEELRPKVLIVGWCCYSRHVDYRAFRAIADSVGAYLLADMAHVSGLVAAGVHPSPVAIADVCTMTIHKTLGGGRGGAILSSGALGERIDEAVFPGAQGGPLAHVIAGHALTFELASRPAFAERMAATLLGARVVADALYEARAELSMEVATGGTEVHQLHLDVSGSGHDANEVLEWLHEVGVHANALRIAYDPLEAPRPSGLRLGTTSLATRGFDEEAFVELAAILRAALSPARVGRRAELQQRSAALCDAYPLYPNSLGAPR